MKKLNIGILSMALVAGLGLVSCNKADVNTNNMGSVIKTKEEVYAYGAFSTSALLSNHSSNMASLAADQTSDSTVANEHVVTDEQLGKINKYIDMFETLVGDQGFKQETVDNTDEGYLDYETKMSVSCGADSYVAYYNESPLNEEDKDVDEEDEDEIETKLSGIMLLGENEYVIEGTKEIEGDEVEISITSKIDDQNYVKVNQEFENGEQEFEYEIMTNGVIEFSSIEIEQEEGKELEVELQLGKDEDTATIYEFKKELIDNESVMKIEVYEGEDNLVEKITVKTVTKEDGTKVNEYTFEDGSKVEKDDD